MEDVAAAVAAGAVATAIGLANEDPAGDPQATVVRASATIRPAGAQVRDGACIIDSGSVAAERQTPPTAPTDAQRLLRRRCILRTQVDRGGEGVEQGPGVRAVVQHGEQIEPTVDNNGCHDLVRTL